ncbi:hypothetical protein Mapa_013663 [Marchantia paleacea]|nr:hypothetical protein Mapa_013663 [Marchantia paleacea]
MHNMYAPQSCPITTHFQPRHCIFHVLSSRKTQYLHNCSSFTRSKHPKIPKIIETEITQREEKQFNTWRYVQKSVRPAVSELVTRKFPNVHCAAIAASRMQSEDVRRFKKSLRDFVTPGTSQL